jgi:5-methylcytosine-specific restriction enzyme subunit McrC
VRTSPRLVATMDSSPLNEGSQPTTAAGVPIRNMWHMLLYAWNEVPVRQDLNVDVDNSPSLDALLASILALLIQQRLRVGLGRSYISEGRLLRGIRGRVDFSESLKKMAFETGQAYCRFQTFTTNAPKNQIVRSTLMYLVQAGDFGPEKVRAEELRQTLRRLVRYLDGVDLIEVTSAFIRRQHLGRNDRNYSLMLAICDLVLQRQMPTEHVGSKPLLGLDRDSLTLYRIFERFVATFYRIHLKDWFVRAQHPLQWHTAKSSQFLPTMVTDLLLRHRGDGRSIVLDTKFTPNSLVRGRSEKLVFDSSHLYQMYAYLRSQEHVSETLRTASGILLYPTVQWHLSEQVQLQGHSIRLETLDLSESWKVIEARLLELISADHAI